MELTCFYGGGEKILDAALIANKVVDSILRGRERGV